MSTPPAIAVMHALKRCTWRRTVFVADEMRRKGYASVRTDLVLKRLRTLETAGHVKCDGIKHGYYGFGWDITPSGENLCVDA